MSKERFPSPKSAEVLTEELSILLSNKLNEDHLPENVKAHVGKSDRLSLVIPVTKTDGTFTQPHELLPVARLIENVLAEYNSSDFLQKSPYSFVLRDYSDTVNILVVDLVTDDDSYLPDEPYV